MPNYKDAQNRIHYLVDARFTHMLPDGCVPITDAEAADLLKPTPEQEAAAAAAAAQAADAADAKAAAKADNVIQYLRDHTPAECEAYVQANVTDLASARALMKKFAVALCVLSKQSLR
jgi:hypothetical protein